MLQRLPLRILVQNDSLTENIKGDWVGGHAVGRREDAHATLGGTQQSFHRTPLVACEFCVRIWDDLQIQRKELLHWDFIGAVAGDAIDHPAPGLRSSRGADSL